MINYKSLLTVVAVAFLGGSVLMVSGCAPRGESQSLSDILDQSRERFRLAELKVGDSPIKAQLSAVSQKLNEIEKVQDPTILKPATTELKNGLIALLPHAGYTVRPAFSEIVNQYQAISNGSQITTDSALPGSPEVRLLVARTYTILASELETGKFSL